LINYYAYNIKNGLGAGPKLGAGLWAGPDAVQAAAGSADPGCMVLIITIVINLLQKKGRPTVAEEKI
jgi:hypothetical protein